jgi:hypothetical protein
VDDSGIRRRRGLGGMPQGIDHPGNVPSERDGMKEFARWLGGLVKEVDHARPDGGSVLGATLRAALL